MHHAGHSRAVVAASAAQSYDSYAEAKWGAKQGFSGQVRNDVNQVLPQQSVCKGSHTLGETSSGNPAAGQAPRMESKDKARRRVLAEKPRNRKASGKLGAVRVVESATNAGQSGDRQECRREQRPCFPQHLPTPPPPPHPRFRAGRL